MTCVAVSGASGRLGSAIVRHLADSGVEIIALGSERKPWPNRVEYREFPDSAAPDRWERCLQGAHVVVNAAPLADAAFHAFALTEGCHVIDVTIGTNTIRGLLSLDNEARRKGCTVIAMGGLSPGLTGVLGVHLLNESPTADFVQVCLLQSATGTAGERGTREMLDMLTQADCRYGLRTIHRTAVAGPTAMRLFDLASPEAMYLQQSERLRFATGFDRAGMNVVVRALAALRAVSPPAYGRVRNAIARRKSVASPAVDEAIEVGAVALSQSKAPLRWRSVKLTSDYGATAAIAASLAMLAVTGRLPAGAGHPCAFLSLQTLLEQPLVRQEVIETGGNG